MLEIRQWNLWVLRTSSAIGCATFDAMALLVAVFGLLRSVLAGRELTLANMRPETNWPSGYGLAESTAAK